jgi:protein-S-isoprenylcysteine O-methyltransferase Ste14
MKATQFEFRFRFLIIVFLYLLGFWAPWTWTAGHYAPPPSTAWLGFSTALARLGMNLETATLLVTVLAILLGLAGGALRVWGTAYLSAPVVHSGAMHGDKVMAAGPYRHLRNPLYLGSLLLAVSIAILMPPSGALVFLVLVAVFYLRLIFGEEAFLAGRLGEPYLEYKKQVPRLLPSLRPRIAAEATQPRWQISLISEFLGVSYPLCLAVLAWRYDPALLVRCLLVCFGLSLVLRAFLPKKAPGPAAGQ